MVGPLASGTPFREADISFLSTLAVQLTTAVQTNALHRQVQQSDRLSTLGTISASLAHEIRNPLTSISTFVQMLGTRTYDSTDDVRRQRAFAAIRESKADEETELWLRRLRDEAFVEIKM